LIAVEPGGNGGSIFRIVLPLATAPVADARYAYAQRAGES